MNIIVVDDDLRSLQDVIMKIRMTAKWEDKVYGFTDPAEMLVYVEGHPCDVAFLKIEMEAMNGLDAASKIQQLRPKANIIFESAFDCYMKKAFEIRCSGYLMQPIKNSDIQGELDNLRFAYAY